MEEPPWKKIKLSLERPYKDDNGKPIPVLLDITQEGQHIYETKESSTARLGDHLRRIFIERGVDFFERRTGQDGYTLNTELAEAEDTIDSPDDTNSDSVKKTMSPEELFKMRMELLPQLFVALGEMSHAKELLTSLLSSINPQQSLTSLLQPEQASEPSPTTHNLSATLVNKPPPIVSVEAFNAQLTIGGKDEALRKAAGLFKTAAESMERSRIQGEKYWVNALKIRRANWGLIPAPLPLGSATGKGADKTSKDFLISYGLEESPPLLRRRAVAQMAAYNNSSEDLVFPHRQRTRLRVSVSSIDASRNVLHVTNTLDSPEQLTLDGELRIAQQEIVEQELFSLLVKEAGALPTATARVSERLIVIDAAQGAELKFELIEEGIFKDTHKGPSDPICGLIYNILHILLLRRHNYLKEERLRSGAAHKSSSTEEPPQVLQPIIDLLQYRVFCTRIELEVGKAGRALTDVGIPATVSFDPIGETGLEVVSQLEEGKNISPLGGQALLRIDQRHTVRLTFLSPSSLTAHLSQATLAVSSVPQLCQLLMDEIERCLLQRICDLGRQLCNDRGGTWFIDLNRCVGRWDGCVLNFRIFYGKDFTIDCSAFQMERGTNEEGLLQVYSSQGSPPEKSLLSWVKDTIAEASANDSVGNNSTALSI
ncbi:subunit 17 of mediator complex-domain-containing protein [Crucibulum laeve]|uniref:Mediator of RNA polymerase II transcription subunit 17 n=1 Tax=Crucibulum laeve TaxID=68775 RepID=A0A5C3MFR7_9AGAR|nr:subunit 17 of mediator complex-domain-containing protein [Crucibulum laeve]